MDAARSVTAAFAIDATFDSTVRAVVTGFYQTILGRAPDQAGLDFWAAEATRVVGLGADVREVFFAMSIAFFGSPEYLNKATSDTQYLTDSTARSSFASRTGQAWRSGRANSPRSSREARC